LLEASDMLVALGILAFGTVAVALVLGGFIYAVRIAEEQSDG
jgi:hypothetical protein